MENNCENTRYALVSSMLLRSWILHNALHTVLWNCFQLNIKFYDFYPFLLRESAILNKNVVRCGNDTTENITLACLQTLAAYKRVALLVWHHLSTFEWNFLRKNVISCLFLKRKVKHSINVFKEYIYLKKLKYL